MLLVEPQYLYKSLIHRVIVTKELKVSIKVVSNMFFALGLLMNLRIMAKKIMSVISLGVTFRHAVKS